MNFIGQWYLKDTSVCDDLIDFFHNDSWAVENQHAGTCYDKGETVNTDFKKSTDVSIRPQDLSHPILQRYQNLLFDTFARYKQRHEWCDKGGPVGMIEGCVIQHYKPSEGFFAWHTERSHGEWPAALRHLTFMTYLNNVTDKGETEWFHQKLKIKPKKGLTVIWPADWTHVHRGIPSPTQEKYIITGWLHYIPSELLQYQIKSK